MAAKKTTKKVPGNSRIAALAAASRVSASGNVPKSNRNEDVDLLAAAASLIGAGAPVPAPLTESVPIVAEDPVEEPDPEQAPEIPAAETSEAAEAPIQSARVLAAPVRIDPAPEPAAAAAAAAAAADLPELTPESEPAVSEPEPAPEPAPDPASSPTVDLDDELSDEVFFAARQAELVRVMSSAEYVLDAQHNSVSKLTYDLPRPLVDVLNRWELDQVKATGRRLYRERLIDMALAGLPEDPDEIIAQTRDLPGWLRYADTEQVGTRVRTEVATNLKVLKQEFKLRREKGIYVRHVYALALFNLLGEYGIEVRDPAAG